MTHQRPSTYQQQQQQQQQFQHQLRRIPDVEEALSSMLWTPYERTPTDSSSEDDDDERLNKRLRRSQSSFDYRSLPATIQLPLSSSYFGADDNMWHATSTQRLTPTAHNTKTVTLCQASPITPFVPFTDLLYNHRNNNNRCRDSDSIVNVATVATMATVAIAPPLQPPTSTSTSIQTPIPTSTSTSPSPPTATNYQVHQQKFNVGGSGNGNGVHNYRFSYPCYGQIPGLHKWWSTAGRVTAASMATKEPPSYDSLYLLSNTARSSSLLKADSGVSQKEEATVEVHSVHNEVVDVQTNQAAEASNSTANDSLMELQVCAVLSARVSSASQVVESNAQSTTNETENDYENNNAEKCIGNSFSCNINQQRQQTAMRLEESISTSTDQLHNQLWHWPNPYYGCEEVFDAHAQQSFENSVSAATLTTDALIPNKCLAELERLYAEFRASESIIERQLNASYTSADTTTTTDDDDDGGKMRLNIPASVAPNKSTENSLISTYSKPGSVSSTVFLNSASSTNNNNNNNGSTVAILTTPTTTTTGTNDSTYKQEGSSGLTIQVNDKSKNFVVEQQDHVSVINCNYVKPPPPPPPPHSTAAAAASNNNCDCDQDNNNVVASVSVNNVSSSSSVPNTINVNNNKINFNNNNNNNNNNNVRNFEISGPGGDVVENIVNNHSNHKKVYRSIATATRGTTTATTNSSNADSVHIINVNNLPTSCTTITNNGSNTTTTITTSTASSSPTITPTHRTFTSTECQTDDISPATPPTTTTTSTTIATTTSSSPTRDRNERPRSSPRHAQAAANSREQRRRERRERRQQQQQLQQHQQHQQHQQQQQHNHLHQQLQQNNPQNLMPSIHAAATRRHIVERHSMPPPSAMTHLHPPHMHHSNHAPPNATMPAAMSALLRPMLPDLLHSHYPPPYSALPLNSANVPSMISLLPPPPAPTSSLLGHTPRNEALAAAVAAASGPPPPPGTTILTPVISTVPIPGGTPIVGDGRFSLPLPIIRRSPSERSGKGCCGQWFAGPPLRALIAVVALGGVACALGGAALGATGLAGPPSSHLTAALLMIGVGVVLVTVSGAAWRMTAPGGPPCLGLGSSVDLGRCGRRPCSRGGAASHGLLYPEFQHRPPPPSYQASMQEYRLRLLLLDRDRQSGVVRGNSPPPTYRSHAGSLLRAPLTTTSRLGGAGGGGSSSVGGSEYSFPPSYRSRNNTATPATISSERSIETAPSGRLLANEDIPEPLSVEQLPEYNTTQYGHNRRTTTVTTITPKTSMDTLQQHELRTSAIVEVDCTPPNNQAKLSPKFSSTAKEVNNSNSAISSSTTNGKELVTIVTISQPITNTTCGSTTQHAAACSAADHIEILAHL